MAGRWIGLFGIGVVLWCSAVHAIQPVRSLYTAIDLAGCEAVQGAAARLCRGLPGYPIYLVEGDRGVFLSVGPHAEKRRAAQQTLSVFNTLFERGGQRPTIEWRFVVRDARPVPYATIVRYLTEGPAGVGEVLVVMRVTEREVCHVAYVDALANLNALVLARRIADKAARSQPCPQEPSVQGARGRSPM